MGADVLLTPEWPQGTAATLDAAHDPSRDALAALGVHLDGVGSANAAAAALARWVGPFWLVHFSCSF
jgi:hypothetical protein